ncbi:hypothetical protein HMPREF9554_00836 [Treponema phagedenis F0421]|uniref:hypothetical protein n=1 Tax=Treponema phagedenis TaxID=162 RepID=UPI0001F63B12|nr:hypothetical protein [Treponema phagedenis]EFW38659.1 hypothetical protein HMPREF9554_00836 [Treponema phagedenis F0421]
MLEKKQITIPAHAPIIAQTLAYTDCTIMQLAEISANNVVAALKTDSGRKHFSFSSKDISWGILYFTQEEIGFYVPASENSMQALYRTLGSMQNNLPKEIHCILNRQTHAAGFLFPAPQKRNLILRLLIPDYEPLCILSWQMHGKPQSVRFQLHSANKKFIETCPRLII